VTHLRKMMLGGNSSVATPSKTHFGSWISAYFPAFVTVLLQFLVDSVRRTYESRLQLFAFVAERRNAPAPKHGIRRNYCLG